MSSRVEANHHRRLNIPGCSRVRQFRRVTSCMAAVSVWIYHFGRFSDMNISRKSIAFNRHPQRKYGLFSPFNDIKLSIADFDTTTAYSSHHCVISNVIGADDETKEETRFVSRTCRFNNLYFHPDTGKFHYFPGPLEKNALGDDTKEWQQLEKDMTVAMGNINAGLKDLKDVPPARIWHPVVERHAKPPEKYAKIDTPSNLVLLLFRPFYSFNVGHLIWDDALSLFSMLDIFGLESSPECKGDERSGSLPDDQLFPLPFYVDEAGFDGRYYACDVSYRRNNAAFKDRWSRCTKMYKRFFPAMFRYETHVSGDIARSGNWLKGEDQEWRGFNSTNFTSASTSTPNNVMPHGASFALVPVAIGGTGRLGQMSCAGDCAVGRSSQLKSFRHFLLSNILWPNYDSIRTEINANGPAGYITFSLPTGSSRPDEVTFFDNIIPIAKRLVGKEKVVVVDMASISIQEEAEVALNTAVLFANHGGGSATSVFLPKDSSIFLYTAGTCSKNGHWCDGGNNHLDNIFYNSNGHLRNRWIEPEDRNNTEKLLSLLRMEYEQTMLDWKMSFTHAS